jgi:hypothetical protein
MNEKTFIERQKILIEKLLNEFMQSREDLYYSSTDEVCDLLIEYIQNQAKLNQEQKELTENLTASDIKIQLSFNSKH